MTRIVRAFGGSGERGQFRVGDRGPGLEGRFRFGGCRVDIWADGEETFGAEKVCVLWRGWGMGGPTK